jgi:hypothetical protein
MKDVWKATRTERRVQDFVRRRASKQLLSVPWIHFRRTQSEYLRWEAFSLWVRSVVESEDRLPAALATALTKKCPGFVEAEKPVDQPSLLAVRLDEWIRNRTFAHIKQEGWLDALLFYSVRDLRSQCVWAHWERCAEEWGRKQPSRYPSFQSWFRAAFRYDPIPKVSVNRLTAAVEDYVDWVSFARWVLPLLECHSELPARAAGEVNRRLPGFLEAGRLFAGNEQKTNATIESRLMRCIENHYFSEAKNESWLGSLRHRVQCHPRYLRIAAYADHWGRQRPRTRVRTYTSFDRWYRAAENHIEGRTRGR